MIFRALLVMAVLAGCRTAPEDAAPGEARQRSGPDAVMRGVTVTQVVNGRVEWEIFARRAWHSRDSGRLNGRDVRVFYYPENRGTATLYASAVRYDVKSRWLKARGQVRVESEGTVLETTELEFDSERERIFTDKEVRVRRGGNVMTGTGLEADPDLNNLEVLEPHIEAGDPEDLKPLVDMLDGPK